MSVNRSGPSLSPAEAVPVDSPVKKSFGFPRPNLTPAEAGCVLAVWMSMQMLAQAPLVNRYSAGFIFLFFFATLLSRNIAIVASTALILNVTCRFLFPISSWHDQHWMQWYGISSLMTGHNILLRSPLAGMSMSNYLPMGDLFGGFFIGLGIQKYWYVWHVVVPLLLLVPVAVAPCAATLIAFVFSVSYWPFCDYTGGGGNLEVQFAMLIAAIATYRHGRITASLVFFAFAAFMRQPFIMLIPFVFILLWRNRDFRRIKMFCALLFFFGAVYILLDLKGAYWYLFRVWDAFQESSFIDLHGLNRNFSVSSLPHVFGVNDTVAWFQWKAFYLPFTLASICVLLVIAWRARQKDTVLFLAVLATIFVYVFARGYAQYHYVVASFFPFVALIGPANQPKRNFERYWCGSLALFVLWVGLAPFAVFVGARVSNGIHAFRAAPPLSVSATAVVSPASLASPVHNIDGVNADRQILSLDQAVEFDFDPPVYPSSVRISGDYVSIMNIKGVDTFWASETEMRGIITHGRFEYSTDGKNFAPLKEFSNTATYSAFPVTFQLPRTSVPIKAIRLRPDRLYLDHREWLLGNVEFFGTKP